MVSVGIGIRRVATRRVLFQPRKHWTTWMKYERGSDAVIAVSEAVGEVAVRSGISPQKVRVIFDGVEIPPRLPDPALRRALRERVSPVMIWDTCSAPSFCTSMCEKRDSTLSTPTTGMGNRWC